jgi:hypothetical protein
VSGPMLQSGRCDKEKSSPSSVGNSSLVVKPVASHCAQLIAPNNLNSGGALIKFQSGHEKVKFSPLQALEALRVVRG